jgi:outer membrane protein OmpA-like peptidoglycan-associated protein
VAPPPAGIVVLHGHGLAVERWAAALDRAGRIYARDAQSGWSGLSVDSAQLRLTDGRPAGMVAAREQVRELALFDLALPIGGSDPSSLAWCAATTASETWRDQTARWLQVAGWQPRQVADAAGLVVARTLAMLINEASDAVLQGVCTAEAADAARREADESRRNAEALAAKATAAKTEAERTTAEVATVAAGLEKQNAQLQKENERLVKERDDLAGQLDGALSSVAQITKTARGVVVNLPDILFDIAKATLKPNTEIALAKLAGIVQVFPKINLRIEGYTDSTGSDELNMRLSKERAEAVLGFLQKQGVAAGRMTAVGYGPKFPVADNATVEGRAKNRRVEIILAEGMIQGAGN